MQLRAALAALDTRAALRAKYHADLAANHQLPNWRRAYTAQAIQTAREFAAERAALVARIEALEVVRHTPSQSLDTKWSA